MKSDIKHKILLTLGLLFILFILITSNITKTTTNTLNSNTATQTEVYKQAFKYKNQKQFVKVTVSQPGFLNIEHQTTLIVYGTSSVAIDQFQNYVKKHHQLPINDKYRYYDLKNGNLVTNQVTYSSNCTFDIAMPITGQHFIKLVNQPDMTDHILTKFNSHLTFILHFTIVLFGTIGLFVIWKPKFIMQYIEPYLQ